MDGKRLALTPILLLGISLGLLWMGPISVAHAGEWVQRSCSYDGEYIAPEGWEAKANYGYREPPQEFCEKVAEGGGLSVYAAPYSGDEPFAGQSWIYKPPHGSTIAGGSLDAKLRARNGSASVVSVVAERDVSQVCEYPDCELYEGEVPVPAGASEVYVRASCLPVSEPDAPSICHTPGSQWSEEANSAFSAEANISSAEIILATRADPKGSGLTGTLLNETVSGTGTLSFMATDPGPGIYQARVRVDGEQVWAETPSTNEGKCVPSGTTEGLRVFDYSQPCPTETSVHAEVHTASLTDGLHTLTVEVEDAAGNVTTVYSGTLMTANHLAPPSIITPAIAPPNRGAANGTPVSETALLRPSAKQPKTFTRAQPGSAVTLTGRLTNPAGTPIKDAQVQLSQQVLGSSAPPSGISNTTTSSDGTWTLKAPKGPSRVLQIAYYSHLLDAVPAAKLDFHESVQAMVSMHAPHRARVGHAVIFSGRLAGGYVPAGGESVQMEILYGGRWRTIEVLPTTSQGRWAYKYEFTLGAGSSYLFRAATVPNGGYPFLSAHSKPVRVTVQR
ncbi:MAG: hypothetical protein WBQ21_05580 [Solirubrobacteraceae bacterium]